jgi:hypothetical protein
VKESLRILYPPASLGMEEAVRNYAAYRKGPQAAWLGRFVLPAARLEEFSRARAALTDAAGAWQLSALIGTDPDSDLAAIEAFNRSAESLAVIDTLEIKAERPGDIPKALARMPKGITAYFEIQAKNPGPFLSELAKSGSRAKLRTGGVTPDRIPEAAEVAGFLATCARARVPFKATAGLHHPFRSMRHLTYSPDSPQAVMHGFMNVFLAAAFAAQGMGAVDLENLLRETNPGAFAGDAGSFRWGEHVLTPDQLREARRDFAIAFGSCSFDEPRLDLEAVGWL